MMIFFKHLTFDLINIVYILSEQYYWMMGILKGPQSIVPPCANGVRDHQWMRQRSFACHVFEEPRVSL